MSQPEKIHLKCQHCGHEWDSQSKGPYTNCPKCMYKVRVRKMITPFQGLEHFNLGPAGVRVLDHNITTPNSRGWITDISFKQGRAWCDYDKSHDCIHIRFALSLPEVKEIFKQKGWKTE
jgi:DNA-directed RNA polymerase subunit RPC12/RpoP